MICCAQTAILHQQIQCYVYLHHLSGKLHPRHHIIIRPHISLPDLKLRSNVTILTYLLIQNHCAQQHVMQLRIDPSHEPKH